MSYSPLCHHLLSAFPPLVRVGSKAGARLHVFLNVRTHPMTPHPALHRRGCRYTLGNDGVVAVTPYTSGEHDTWFNIQMSVPLYTLKMMGANPLWAPPNATHLLRSSSVVLAVNLTDGALCYATFDARSVDRMRISPSFSRTGVQLAHAPALVVTAAGHPLPRINATDLHRRGAVGWAFDDESGVLDVAHNASNVCVRGGSVAPGDLVL